ncbi:glycosyltransferase family 4 protein [Tunturiibacter gelidoferens]|uniref:Glycosyltransferase involved in cell wall biosynthesis n=1 Tax=Tunturiibacter gelidiferens TaxID=3069689 RepID=A0ACC5NV24_9BACT|nr:glycosyltransferase family 4 protein [Edaphobacter lichenicola]MBB5338425.1 glycosyltransferase involved in cell wall biosynthesis [Edaphobacter lichenicola]
MRIIHMIPGTADPNSANGVNKVVHWLATNMVAQGHECEVWILLPTEEHSNHARTYKLVPFPGSRSQLGLTKDLHAALSDLPEGTWVQLHSVFVPQLTSAAKLLHKRKIQFGITPHGGYLSDRSGRSIAGRIRKRLYLSAWEGWTLRNASLIHAIGQTEVDDLKSRFSSLHQIALIPNGFELPNHETASQPGLESRSDTEIIKPTITYCGRMVIFQKGLDILLEGFAAYRKLGGTLNLTMVGDGPDRPQLEALAKEHGIVESITWTGQIFGAPLRNILSGSTFFVHSSRFDVIPTACLEAASCGVPLIVSEETNLADFVRHSGSGLVLTPNTPTRLAELLVEAEKLGVTERTRMGASAKLMIERDFTWSEISRHLVLAIEHATHP